MRQSGYAASFHACRETSKQSLELCEVAPVGGSNLLKDLNRLPLLILSFSRASLKKEHNCEEMVANQEPLVSGHVSQKNWKPGLVEAKSEALSTFAIHRLNARNISDAPSLRSILGANGAWESWTFVKSMWFCTLLSLNSFLGVERV